MNEIERGLAEMAGVGLDRDFEAAAVRAAMLPVVDEEEREPPEDEELEPVADTGRPPAKPPRPFDNQRTAPGSTRDLLRRATIRAYHRSRFYVRCAMSEREHRRLKEYAREYRLSMGTILRVSFDMVERSGAPLNFIPNTNVPVKKGTAAK